MKAAVIEEAGGPEKLEIRDVAVPKVKEGWSLIRVIGRGINHSEIFTRKGLSPSVQFPRILGIECVGVVAETSDAQELPVGTKVISIMGEMGRAFDGSYAEYVLLPNEQIYPFESDLPWEVIAAIPETFYTAFGSMKNLKIDAGDQILVRGGTSGVGVAFLKLVKAEYPDAMVVGTTRDEAKRGQLLAAGFDEVLVEKDGILQSDRTFRKALELIGPATLKDTSRHIEEGGIVCSTGQLGGKWYMDDDFDPIMDLPRNGYLTSFYSGNVSKERIQEMMDYVARYHVDAAPEKVFRLEEIREAHEYLEGSRSFGKVVVMSE